MKRISDTLPSKAGDGSTIKFWAEIAKVQTMADGGLRVYLDLPEGAVEQAAILMQYKRLGVVADVTVVPKKQAITGNGTKNKNELGKRPKRKSEWTTEKA